ncbi:MAG: hypothetical protein HXX19_00195 [Rhodoferax sp.]|nr:hypothetical protein [Rhodoferax sp.]
MSHAPTQEIQMNAADQHALDAFDDAFDTIGDYHRKAAHYFMQAARHHLAAAAADDDGDAAAQEMHAFKAYRQQLNGVHCAEIAAMERDDETEELQALQAQMSETV